MTSFKTAFAIASITLGLGIASLSPASAAGMMDPSMKMGDGDRMDMKPGMGGHKMMMHRRQMMRMSNMCSAKASRRHLHGMARSMFVKRCMRMG